MQKVFTCDPKITYLPVGSLQQNQGCQYSFLLKLSVWLIDIRSESVSELDKQGKICTHEKQSEWKNSQEWNIYAYMTHLKLF